MLANFLASALEFTSDKVTLDYPQQQRSKQQEPASEAKDGKAVSSSREASRSKQQAFTSSTSTLDYQQKEQKAW